MKGMVGVLLGGEIKEGKSQMTIEKIRMVVGMVTRFRDLQW